MPDPLSSNIVKKKSNNEKDVHPNFVGIVFIIKWTNSNTKLDPSRCYFVRYLAQPLRQLPYLFRILNSLLWIIWKVSGSMFRIDESV